MPGPAPAPTTIRALRGNRGKRPTKEPPDFGKLAAEPPAPDRLDEESRNAWERLAPLLFKAGLLKATDLDALEALCVAIGQAQTCTEILARDGFIYNHPQRGPCKHIASLLRRDAIDIIAKFSARFGLTPADRARLAAPADDGNENPFNKF